MLNQIKKIIHSYVQCTHCGTKINLEINSHTIRNSESQLSIGSDEQSPPSYIQCENCLGRIDLVVNAQGTIKREPLDGSSRVVVRNNEKSFRPGRVTRNPFLNFLRAQRETVHANSILDIAKEGAMKWREMTPVQKCPFIAEAHHCPRRKYSRRLKGERRIRRKRQ